jgi:predicted NUDIX family phosphoesterase/nicotinamide mononucleotide adenylyltransferase
MEEDVAVIPKDDLRTLVARNGFGKVVIDWRRFLGACRSRIREEAEQDFSVVQLVSVFLVRVGDRWLTYRRSGKLPEQRLRGALSVHVGGHVRPEELSFFNPLVMPQEDPAVGFLTRELHEEISFPPDAPPAIKYVGVIYDERVLVSSQHLGIVFVVESSSEFCAMRERGYVFQSEFVTLSELVANVSSFENWSELLINFLDTGMPTTGNGFRAKSAYVCGRFQIPHLQHLEYLCRALEVSETITIGIVQPDVAALAASPLAPHRAEPDANPLSYGERKNLLGAMLDEAGIDRGRFSFTPFPLDNPDKLLDQCKPPALVLITESDHWSGAKAKVLASLGYAVESLYTRTDNCLRSSEIRSKIRRQDASWRTMVPRSVAEGLAQMGVLQRMTASGVDSPTS